ncbi:hypothetical protein SAMN05444487_102221 [Marininema mesophilum]|uniref:Uncharacterized protein n=1 Tax=Marininema mesophilum TaxID=1048340 RepID=A0A1H2SHU1_9BACL|nr:hypothetical protein [Marininema mesophilum]SDW31088.1 hypothetical protein SAMN05444487_102221 [Marininema mesophilum]
MKSQGIKKGRYYERFQVEDAVTFYSGQLVSAKSPDGAQVFLQEIPLDKPLPPGSMELLSGLQREHIAPVLDVIEEEDRIVLVHPPLGGEPLSFMVLPRKGMEPIRALTVYRQLLRTAVRLSEISPPIFTTLDPRNIILEENRPYALFISFDPFNKDNGEEKWRYLLYFLLTGFQLEKRPENPEKEKGIQALPQQLKSLVLSAMDLEKPMKEVLEAAEAVTLPRKISASRRGKSKSWRYWLPSAVAVVAIVGLLVGLEVFGDKGSAIAGEEKQAEAQLSKPKGRATFDNVIFQRQKTRTETLPPSVQGTFRVRGELTQADHAPFSLSLESENVESDFGLRVDDKGGLQLYQYVNGETFKMANSKDNFRIQPKKKYIVDIYYVPNQPFRVSLTEKGTNKQWVAIGKVPMDSIFKITLEGQQGTSFNQPAITKLQDAKSVADVWMKDSPWTLMEGTGVIDGKRFNLDSDSRVNLKPGQNNFSFKRAEDFNGDPLRMEMENADGSRYQFNWLHSGRLELSRLDYNLQQLASGKMSSGWVPDRKSSVSIAGNTQEFSVGVKQGSLEKQVQHQPDGPIALRSITILSQSGLTLFDQ